MISMASNDVGQLKWTIETPDKHARKSEWEKMIVEFELKPNTTPATPSSPKRVENKKTSPPSSSPSPPSKMNLSFLLN